MKKDLHEGGSVTKYLRQIQEIQLELQGINQCVPEVDVVEWMCNTLHPSYETTYNAFRGKDVLPTFETIVARLIQEETHINTRRGLNASTKTNALAMKMQKFLHMGGLHQIMEVWGMSSSSHESNNYRPSTSGVAQPGNHNRIGPCNWCSCWGHLM